jgi:hypothetical protein
MLHTIVTYLFLVGIPLAGLMGILKIGEGLKAPRPLAGTWVAVEGASRGAWEPGCRTSAAADEEQGPSEVRLAQSGARANVSWPAVRADKFYLTLNGDSIQGKLKLQSGEDCPGGVLTLRGEIKEVNARGRITGELRREDCAKGNCQPIPVDWRQQRR